VHLLSLSLSHVVRLKIGRAARRSTVLHAVALISVACLCWLSTTSSAHASFGFLPGAEGFSFSANEAPPPGSEQGVLGPVDVRAGSHPYSVTTSFTLKTTTDALGETIPDEDLKDIRVELPPGLVGNANLLPQCSTQQLTTPIIGGRAFNTGMCPASTVVGFAAIKQGTAGFHYVSVYNLVPSPGLPAEFGMNFGGVPILLTPSVRTGGDYGLTISSDGTNQALRLYAVTVTFWGVPADPSHDEQRGLCLDEFGPAPSGVACPASETPKPFLTLPTSCVGALTATVHADSWQNPGSVNAEGLPALSDPRWVTDSSETVDGLGDPVELDGCDSLAFKPTISLSPDTAQSDTPAGLGVEVTVPQDGLLNTTGTAPADLRNTTVTLPEGIVINPGQAAGLAACQTDQDGVGTEDAPSCPAASKVGAVEIETPLLRDTLKGTIYVLQSNPPDLELLVAAAADGVDVKLVGHVRLDESTGRLTASFADTPQLPFTAFRLSFSGGAQAALATPTTCGVKQATADFTPWTAPLAGDFLTEAGFTIATAPSGGGCASPLPFSPSLIAGSTTDQAGGYTSFSLLLQRGDGQQRISTLQFKTPEGLLGMISKVPLCPEPQASQGACSAASEIGHTVVQAGPGPYPLVVPEPGQPPAPIYLTGGYKGAPYGLSVVVPLVVGPFTLQTQVVRAAIAVDPRTAQLTITTDPLPAIVDGIPTDLRTVNAVIDRPGFMFNPTDCSPQAFSGTATSTEGVAAAISSHFQVGSCGSLAFKPDFKVSTSAKTSKASGASLDAKIVYPTTPTANNQASSQANIASVKVDLPKQLPSRLTTLQKACLARVFEANPASCPKDSVVGHATAVTPVLPVPLSGPAYFVSHGGEAFPSLIIVLQGYGVTVDLVGTTFISKAGITSSTFKQVPDVPISSFELSLPEGTSSALAADLPAKAKGSFCGQTLAMPTAFTAQNGAVIKQSTKITVSGCAGTKRVKRHKAGARKAKAKGHARKPSNDRRKSS
jgi:hypothetical protein